MKLSISFVIPAYNCAATLSESIASIFDGNFEAGDEVIIVNDSSTDNTEKVSKELAFKYGPHITITSNEKNKGCPASRNIGIRQSKNDLIFNLDSDNILVPQSIKKLKDALLMQRADVAAFQEYRYFKRVPTKVTHSWMCVDQQLTLANFLSGTINPGPGGNFLYRKDVWKRVGGYWEYGRGLHEAWGFSLKLLVQGALFFVVPHTFYFHRYGHKSLFVRENAGAGESVKVTNKFIESAQLLPLLDNKSQEYIKNTPNWFDFLDSRPLRLRNSPIGKNGKKTFSSPLKQVLRILYDIFSN